MKFEKGLKINLGGYQSLNLSVSDAESWDDCDKTIWEHIKQRNIKVNDDVLKLLGKYVAPPEPSDEDKRFVENLSKSID